MSLWSGFIKSLSKLSMIGRALMLPISLLPAAGLLLAFGDKFHMPLMMNAGGIIFDNLPMLFAIGSAVGLASESGIAALSAAVSVFITNITISTVLGITPEMASQGGKYAMVVGIPTLQMGFLAVSSAVFSRRGVITASMRCSCLSSLASSRVSVSWRSPRHFSHLSSACCCLMSGNISSRY